MKAVIFSFTRQAAFLSLTLQEHFLEDSIPCICYTMEKYATVSNLSPLTKPLKETVSDCFSKDTILIFVSACGIAVRTIAPYIQNKTQDPCVLVIDEKGNYVISLLSGHLGGGNHYATKAASYLDATPIISTATDLNHLFSVDIFAKKNNLTLSNMELAKKISSRLLDGLPVGIEGVLPKGTVPNGIVPIENGFFDIGFSICPFYQTFSFKETLFLIPKQVVLGIGCKKNTDIQNLQNFITRILEEHSIFPESIAAIASIDLKEKEPALIALSKHFSVPFVTYDAKTLLSVKGDFSSSAFVKAVTGVDNVCERAALAYSKADSFYLKKTAEAGMTVAISLIPMEYHF